jgi:hypothetical protein
MALNMIRSTRQDSKPVSGAIPPVVTMFSSKCYKTFLSPSASSSSSSPPTMLNLSKLERLAFSNFYKLVYYSGVR